MNTRDESKAPDHFDATEQRGRTYVSAHEATWALWAVLRSADEAEHATARLLNLPYSDALALDHILSSAEPLGPAELSRRLGITAASATVLVDRLVDSGHLLRRRDPADRRRRILVATDRAKQDAVEVMTPLLDDLDAVAARLPVETATAVITYLRQVAEVHRRHSGRHSRARAGGGPGDRSAGE